MDFKQLHQQTLPKLEQLLRDIFPAGKLLGREFKVGNLRGEAGDSLSINLDTGQWADFATGDKGGDFVSLLASKLGYRQSDAGALVSVMLEDRSAGRKELQFILGGGKRAGRVNDQSLSGPSPTWNTDQLIIGEWGSPGWVWEYRNSTGRLIFVVCRYGEDSAKTYRPWVWDGQRWVCRAYDEGRPLYNLATLLENPNARVLIVEGEKCADVAKAVLGEWFVPVTWAGGAKAVKNTVWSPLKGRHVVIWPDADPPGHQAGVDIIRQIEGIAASIHTLSVHDFPPGADVADMDMDGPTLAAWLDANLIRHERPARGEKLPAGEEWKIDLQITEKGGVRNTYHNISIIVQNDTYFTEKWWFEEWDGRFYIGTKATTDADVFEARVYLSKNYGIEAGGDTMYQALEAGLERRNTTQEWLKSLKWDGTPRFEQLARDIFKTPAAIPYVSEVMRLLFCGMVARAMEPGCKFDYCVILRGPQGIGKTLFYERLGGERYVMLYSRTTQDKDILGAVAMGWVVSIEELFDTRASLRELKSMISSTTDTWRRPYHRDLTSQPKRCVLVGTTDAEADFLDDMAGYRRFLIIECTKEKFDLVLFTQIREQLFAEAYDRWSKVPLWHQLSIVALEESQVVTSNWEVGDAWSEPIMTHLLGKDTTTMLDILTNCLFLPASTHDSRITRRVHRVLIGLGWKQARLRLKGAAGKVGRLRAYQRAEADSPETESPN